MTPNELLQRYAAYKTALLLLKSNYQSVAERKKALSVRDDFEWDIRTYGILDCILNPQENSDV